MSQNLLYTQSKFAFDNLLVLQETRESHVAVHYTVSPAGAGYFVTGEANADLPMQCDCCLATFRQPVTAPFKVLHHTASAAIDLDAYISCFVVSTNIKRCV